MKKLFDKISNIKYRSYRIVVFSFAVFVITPCLLTVGFKQARADHVHSKNVLILNSYHKGFSWTDNQVSAAKEVLEKTFDDLEINVEYMDTKRIYSKEFLEQLSHVYRFKYADLKLDAIITSDDNALRFVMQHHKDIFGEAPVSFCGINDYDDSLLKGKTQFTGLVEVLDIKPTIDLALKLHPDTRKVIVVVDSTPTGLGQKKAVTEISHQYKTLEFEYLEGKDLTTHELLEKLRMLPKNSICLLTVWLRDKNNEYLPPVKGGKLISSSSAVPVYGIIDMYYSEGIVGGKLLHSSTHGRIAAELAVRIMKGEKPSAMPVLIESTNPYMFDYKQLERWNISKSALPAGSIFINEPFSFYKTYKKIIWVVIIAFVTLILFVVALSFNVYRRKKIQNDLINEISERKRTEKILKESEERFKIIFDQATVGISQIESKTGQFIRVNQRFCDIFGFTKEEITSKTFMGITHPDDLQEDLNEMKKLIAGEIREFSMEKRYFHKNGATVLGNLFVSPMWGVGKEPNYHIAIVEDITERKTKEQKMRQVQKMEAMGTLAGGIAHDFNNILAGIIGYAELARDDTPKNSPLKDYLEGILKSSNRAKDLVSQILTFSRKSQEKRQPVQLSMIVEEVVKLIRSTIPTTIEIRQNIDDAIAFINADPTQMHQIVINLCTNAAHAMQETEGVLEIVLSSIDITQESMIKHHDISPGPFLKLEISDTGTGIDPKIIHRIFEPFFTTKLRDKGTGMGLAVVHGIVKDHGGDISIDSQLGKGTTFTILLPRVISRPDKEEDTESEIPTGNEHILFVDDEKVLTNLSKKILESLGYTVTVMNSSIEALETFQKSPNTFDIVITDQTMPNMTGYNLAKRILEIKPLIPVIICTGYSKTLTVEKAEDAGIKALIYKPISRKEIAQKIRGVLDKHNHE